MNQPAKATTVTIIGASLGGIALVANLGLLGYRLRLHNRDGAPHAKDRVAIDEDVGVGDAPRALHTIWV